jgi:4-amino-4-deoxy-L-arabinose transferase-like glycosyltransferase
MKGFDSILAPSALTAPPRARSAIVFSREAALWLTYGVLVAVGFLWRPLTPIDETRYLTVAWEMWARADWLVPHLNGAPYDHKPPLLFWLIHAGWFVFGVNEWWPRLIGPLLTLGNLVLLKKIYRALWPSRAESRTAPVLFLGAWFIALYSTAVMFDMLLLFFVLLAWHQLIDANRTGSFRAMAGFGIAVGLGILAKGPVALVYTLPPVLMAAAWGIQGQSRLSRAGLAIGLLLALAPPAAWLLVVAKTADGHYLQRVLFEQTLHRVTGDLGHGRPWWWYAPRIPLALLPWILWPAMWRAWFASKPTWGEPGVRFGTIVLIAPVLILSLLIGGKQIHYMVPVIAAGALLSARWLGQGDRQPVVGFVLPVLMALPGVMLAAYLLAETGDAPNRWLAAVPLGGLAAVTAAGVGLLVFRRVQGPNATVAIALASVAFCAALLATIFHVAGPSHDLTAASRYIAAQQAVSRPVAMLADSYQGEFGFLGRLRQPLAVLDAEDVPGWFAANPTGLLIGGSHRIHVGKSVTVEYRQPYRANELIMIGAATARASDVSFSNG